VLPFEGMLWGGYVARQRHYHFRHIMHEAAKGSKRSTRLDIEIVPCETHIKIDILHHFVSGRQLKDLPTSDGVLTANQYLDYYVKQYLNHGIHPTCESSLPNLPLIHDTSTHICTPLQAQPLTPQPSKLVSPTPHELGRRPSAARQEDNQSTCPLYPSHA